MRASETMKVVRRITFNSIGDINDISAGEEMKGVKMQLKRRYCFRS